MKSIIERAIHGNVSEAEVTSMGGGDVASGLNELSIAIARQYADGSISYKDADRAMNAIWAEILGIISSRGPKFEIPQPTYSIYETFDAGEWNRGGGKDPVANYTDPLIAEILKNA